MGIYDPLKAFLISSGAEQVPLRFEEIEALIGVRLPRSQRYAAWWSNNPSNNTMTRAWLEAGYRTERLDLAGRKVVFRRGAHKAHAAANRNVAERLRTTLAGTARIASGVDLTQPTGEIWDAQTS
jgi:hypothetical protein